MLRIVLLALALTLSLGCSLKETADEVKDTSKKIEEQSKQIRKRTNDLEYEMSKLYSNQELGHQLDELFAENEHDSPEGVNDDPAMLVAAGIAMHAMYFQTWKGDQGESLAELDYRFAKSLEILFGRLLVHIPADYKVNVFRPTRSYMGIAALATYMDELDLRFERLLKKKRLPHLSLYNVLAQTLKDRNVLGELLPVTTNLILTRKRETQYILQLRHNYFPLMVVARMTDIKDRGDLERLWMSWKGQRVDLANIEVAEMREWITWLEKAKRTRADLEAAGIAPQFNGIFADLVSGVDFGQKSLLTLKPGADPYNRNEVLRQLAEVYSQLSDQAAGRAQ